MLPIVTTKTGPQLDGRKGKKLFWREARLRVARAHRHLLQRRLKIAGAWWSERNAECLLHFRAARANGDWDKSWAEFATN